MQMYALRFSSPNGNHLVNLIHLNDLQNSVQVLLMAPVAPHAWLFFYLEISWSILSKEAYEP